jgi:hypothetical protein
LKPPGGRLGMSPRDIGWGRAGYGIRGLSGCESDDRQNAPARLGKGRFVQCARAVDASHFDPI